VDAFAAAAAESLGWLIRGGESQHIGGVHRPGRAAAAGQKDPQLWLNDAGHLATSPVSQPCHAVKGPADLPGGWGAVWW